MTSPSPCSIPMNAEAGPPGAPTTRAAAEDNACADDRGTCHLRLIVLPLFRDIAAAAQASGYFSIASSFVTRCAPREAAPAPFVTGAFLGLARRQPGWEEDYAGVMKVIPAGGATLILERKCPAFAQTGSASIEALSEYRLIEMVREIMLATFA